MARCGAAAAGRGAGSLAAVAVLALLLLLRTGGASASSSAQEEEGARNQEGVVHIVYMGAAAPAGGGGGVQVTAATLQAESRARHQAMLAVIAGGSGISTTTTGKSSSAPPPPRLVYSYGRSFQGFAAVLTPAQAASARSMAGVARVFPSRLRHPHTTRSWNFLGLQDDDEQDGDGDGGTGSSTGSWSSASVWARSQYGRDTVVGIVDTGVWPESASFRDDGMAPVPRWWRGVCAGGQGWNASLHCNRKLIGARFYYQGVRLQQQQVDDDEVLSARDTAGHGTHTASTAAGRVVPGASEYGLAAGAARGGAPRARLAVYKVCWRSGCSDADILAALDDAVADGVHVLSVSLGSAPPLPQFFEDAVALGSFHALQAGVLVVASAGNSGPGPGSVTNVAPWLLTVAATSVDREFATAVTLGDNRTFVGAGISPWESGWRPLVYAGDVGVNGSSDAGGLIDSSHCGAGSLDPAKVAGAIVVCLHAAGDGAGKRTAKSEVVRGAGGAGLVLVDDAGRREALAFVLPAALVDVPTGGAILYYIRSVGGNSTSGAATARLMRTVEVDGVAPAPVVPRFSARGPSSLAPGILKPDLAAPGVNILASWSPLAPPSELGRAADPRALPFHVLSGTSMACPHAAGAAALLRTLRPDWSPAAVKSALMTTATVRDNTRAPLLADAVAAAAPATVAAAGPLDYGAGQMDLACAADPGLVYDAGPAEFARFLCSTGGSGGGYTTSLLRLLTGNATDQCPPSPVNTTTGASTSGSGGGGGTAAELNYPSITVTQAAVGTVSLTRTVTYVGELEPRQTPPPVVAAPTRTSSVEFRATVQQPAGVRVAVVPDRLAFRAPGEKRTFRVDVAVEQRGSVGSWVFGALTWSDGVRTVRSPISVGF